MQNERLEMVGCSGRFSKQCSIRAIRLSLGPTIDNPVYASNVMFIRSIPPQTLLTAHVVTVEPSAATRVEI